MSRGVDELVLFSEVWGIETSCWIPKPDSKRDDEPIFGQHFEIIRRETAGYVPGVGHVSGPKVVYEIDGHGVPREDFLAVIAALNTVRR